MKRRWWKEAVVYQIYPRSFMDLNNDGIGDIQGIISKLDYLKDLGITVIWICPIYTSPNDDNGYDISDYKGIMTDFGTMIDFNQLLNEVHKRGMKIIMDLVINHTSDEHPWFIESKSSKENPYRDYYIWRPEKNGKEPNNWESIFGGSVWEYDPNTKEYFMHVFSKRQPDLNWENAKVRDDLYKIINWWLEKGIDGFRVDAISHIKKTKDFPDLPNRKKLPYVPSFKGHMNRPGIHDFLKELKRETFDHYDIMTVGEANGVRVGEAEKWVGEENGIFNMIFQFEHLDLWGKSTGGKLDILRLKKTLTKWQKALQEDGWNALFLENHDQPRSVSSWGNHDQYWEKSAKCLATMYFLMKGTPFIYQGQEIGMTNVKFSSIQDYRDIAAKNLYAQELEQGNLHEEIMGLIWCNGRDNSRTPMQWTSEENAGFTQGIPWIKVNPNYVKINVENQVHQPQSIYHYYKNLIELRTQHDVLIYGNYEMIVKGHKQIFAYTRTLGDESWLILTNLFPKTAICSLPNKWAGCDRELILCNYEVGHEHTREMLLNPYEARVYRLKNTLIS